MSRPVTHDLQLVDGIIIHTFGSATETLYDLSGSPLTKEQWLDGLDRILDEDAAMYEGADAAVVCWQKRGYLVAFVTARPYLFDALTRVWLAKRGLVGLLFMKEDIDAESADYKTDVLVGLQTSAHLDIEYAYGNATTDICAYARAGVDVAKTYIIGRHGGEACRGYASTQPMTDYPSHLADLDRDVTAD